MVDGVLNIAHRGYTREWPGNTLEAIEAAIGLGVDAVEVDVRETADGCFILAHDATIEGRTIGDMTLPELMGIDVGLRCRVPTLEEALDVCRGEVGVVLELKDVKSIGWFLEIIKGSGEEGRVGVCSFYPALLRKVKESGLRMGLIVDALPREPVEVLEGLGCEVIGVRAPHITASLVTEVQASGKMVFGWGVEDDSGVDRLMGMGVDGLVSDFPDVVRGRVSVNLDT